MKTIILITVTTLLYFNLLAQDKPKLIIPNSQVGMIKQLSFSTNDKYIITSGGSANLWEVNSGRLLKSFNDKLGFGINSSLLNFNSTKLITTSRFEVSIWNLLTAERIYSIDRDLALGIQSEPLFASFKTNEDDQNIIICSRDTINYWNGKELKLSKALASSNEKIENVTFYDNSNVKFIDGDRNREWYSMDGKIKCVPVDNDQVQVLYADKNGTFNSKPIVIGNPSFGENERIIYLTISTDSKIVSIVKSKSIEFWSLKSPKELFTIENDAGKEFEYESELSKDSKFLVLKTMNLIRVFDLTSKKPTLYQEFLGYPDSLVYHFISAFAISNDSKKLALAITGRQASVNIYDLQTGILLNKLKTFIKPIDNVAFLDSTKTWKISENLVYDTSSKKLLKIPLSIITSTIVNGDREKEEFVGHNQVWELRTGKLLKNKAGKVFLWAKDPLYGWVRDMPWRQDPRRKSEIDPSDLKTIGELKFNGDIRDYHSTGGLILKEGDIIKVINLKDTTKNISFALIDSTGWLVTHPSGLFDASREAMEKLYYVQGMDVISFNQLKERYYEPGLWKKVMSGEKLRNVVGMKSIELPPDIQVGQVDTKGYLPIELINKGGGIGEVTVLINGKEVIADARPKGSDSKVKQLSLKVFISNNKALIKGAENYIAVKAWNEGHWVVSRGSVVNYSVEGIETAYKPAIHIITSGVSDYTGTELDLKYAAKDAEDVSKALQLGAKKLFGTEKSYMYNLTTSQPTAQYPTKANILKAFEKVSSVAHPLDVVVVYLSGHGINHGGQDGDWYYLTQDAYTASSTAYNDPEIRRTSTISSNELVELFKKVPALKQVLMIDACASGKVVENLMAKKDIESTTLRALDRMRDRTGLHIITGCTADAVSYEASKYGQGVLTYSLLEGIRGAALREDQFVDVNKLFQYAHDRVPALAEGIGGIQTPQVFSPQGGQSFDIGLLTEQEKKDIPIAKIRPVYIRSSFIDDDQLEDALQLGKKVDEALNETASKGTTASLIFVDVREYPEGCKLSGKYKQEGGIIKLMLRKKCEGKDETLEISGKTIEEVKNKIIGNL